METEPANHVLSLKPQSIQLAGPSSARDHAPEVLEDPDEKGSAEGILKIHL